MCNMPSRFRQPFERLVRWRIVAKADSIGLLGADALPLLCREVEEGHEFLTILLQAQGGLGVFCLIGFDEQIERLFRIVLGLGLPDVVDRSLGLWL